MKKVFLAMLIIAVCLTFAVQANAAAYNAYNFSINVKPVYDTKNLTAEPNWTLILKVKSANYTVGGFFPKADNTEEIAKLVVGDFSYFNTVTALGTDGYYCGASVDDSAATLTLVFTGADKFQVALDTGIKIATLLSNKIQALIPTQACDISFTKIPFYKASKKAPNGSFFRIENPAYQYTNPAQY